MKSATPRVFLDSNIWFSAFYHSPNCEQLLVAYKDKKIKVIISLQVLDESIRNIREKIPHQLVSFQNLILNSQPEIVADPQKIPSTIKELVSPEDQPIFTAAMKSKVKYFIAGNTNDFKIEKLEKLTGIKILTPKQAVNIINL